MPLSHGTRMQLKWYGNEVKRNIKIGMTTRLRLAAQLLRDQVVRNISRPVRKYKGPRSKRIQVDPDSRSKPGEFPKADTTRLMKDIFWELRGKDRAIVGTSLDYGLILETRMNRSFLMRTLREMQPALRKILATEHGGPRLPGQDR